MCYSVVMEIEVIKKNIQPILKSYGVKKASVFGSVARNEAEKNSDVDLVVELGKPLGLIAYNKMAAEIEAVVGCKVDLLTNKSINKFMAPFIIPELKVIYEG